MTPPDWAPIVAEWGEAASRCPHRVEYRAGCCGGTTFRCEGGRRHLEFVPSIRDCAECFADHGPIEARETAPMSTPADVPDAPPTAHPPARRVRDRPGRSGPIVPPRSLVVTLAYERIDIETDENLRELERRGVEVKRNWMNSALSMNRSILASNALHDGRPAIMFIDSDIKFNPDAVIDLLNCPEGCLHVAYAKKGPPEYACQFPPGTGKVRFGDPDAPLVPTLYAPGGFLAIKTSLIRKVIDHHNLRELNTRWGRGWWPLFYDHVLVDDDGRHAHGLEPDYAFSWRVREAGETVWCVPKWRLEHIGRYGYGAEEAKTPWPERAPRWQVVEHDFG